MQVLCTLKLKRNIYHKVEGKSFPLGKKIFYFILFFFLTRDPYKKIYWKITLIFICFTAYRETCRLLVNSALHHGQKNYSPCNKDLGVFHRRADTASKRPCPEWKGRKVLAGGAQVLGSLVSSITASAHASMHFLWAWEETQWRIRLLM